MPEGTDKCFNSPKGYIRSDRRDMLPMLRLIDLLEAGLISVGDDLVWKRRNSRVTFTAKILPNGMIKTSDGVLHSSPSMAARHVNMGISTNGWRVWQLATSKQSLFELRRILDSNSTPASDSGFSDKNQLNLSKV